MKCPYKAKFRTRARARKYQSIYNNKDGYKLHVYKCPLCGNYHISKFRHPITYSKKCKKQQYRHIQDAKIVKEARKAKGQKHLRIYECTTCNYYHISTKRK